MVYLIQNTTFQSNHAQGKGGAIYLDHSLLDTSHQLTMQNVQCRGNSASFGSSTGGCLYSRGSLSLSVKDSIIADNMSALSGAGLAIHDAGQPLVLENVTLTKNRARGGEGGALLVEASSELNVTPVQILSSTFEDKSWHRWCCQHWEHVEWDEISRWWVSVVRYEPYRHNLVLVEPLFSFPSTLYLRITIRIY